MKLLKGIKLVEGEGHTESEGAISSMTRDFFKVIYRELSCVS